jgi:rare lipoprotein A (peptidoglycan hydrolase)
VRKRLEGSLPIGGACILLLSLSALFIQLAGGQLQGLRQARAAQQQQNTAETKAQQKQTFEGKIMRSGGKLVLTDSIHRSTYQLDDQQLVVFFEGKEVKVTGTLDAKSQTIYISDMGLSNAKHAAAKTTPRRHKTPTPIWYGVASWYGRDNQGPRTANGERFDDQALTAAHPRLPLGTRVRVTNLRNGRSALVRVNDRGPFTPGRLIDLTKGAAQQLGFVRQGLAHVRISVVSIPRASPTS